VTAMTPGEEALREGAAVVERLPRAVFAVTGERPLGYLHDVLAQDVVALTPGRGALAAVLTANGRIAAEIRVLPVDGRVWLDAELEAADGVSRFVAKPAPLAGCEVVSVDHVAVAAVRGPATDATLRDAGIATPGPTEAEFTDAGGVLVVRVVWGVPGVDLIGPPDDVDAVLARIRSPRASVAELDAARIEAGRPRFGPDMNEDVLVNETPLLDRGVSMTKGCYPGQESVARVHNLGRVRRSLRGLRSIATLTVGSTVFVGDKEVGFVTSVASAPGRGSFAIAFLRDETEIGATVRVSDADADVLPLP
jgi:folate-binding protein YgfZ